MDGKPRDSSIAAALLGGSSGLDQHGIGGRSVDPHGRATEEPRDDQFSPSDVATEVSREFDPPEARQPSVITSEEARGAESSHGGGDRPPSVGGSLSGEQVPSRGDDGPTRGSGHQGGDEASRITDELNLMTDAYYEGPLYSRTNGNRRRSQQSIIAQRAFEKAARARTDTSNAELRPSTTRAVIRDLNDSARERLRSPQNSADRSKSVSPQMDTQPPSSRPTLSTTASVRRRRSSPRPLGPLPGVVDRATWIDPRSSTRGDSGIDESDCSPPFQIRRRVQDDPVSDNPRPSSSSGGFPPSQPGVVSLQPQLPHHPTLPPLALPPERQDHHRDGPATAKHNNPSERAQPPTPPSSALTAVLEAQSGSRRCDSIVHDTSVYRYPGEMSWVTPARDAALRLIDPTRRMKATAEAFGIHRTHELDDLRDALDDENLMSRVAAVAELLGFQTDSVRLYGAVWPAAGWREAANGRLNRSSPTTRSPTGLRRLQ